MLTFEQAVEAFGNYSHVYDGQGRAYTVLDVETTGDARIDGRWHVVVEDNETGRQRSYTRERGAAVSWLFATPLDTESSASRQHYIDTGEYLPRGEAHQI